MQAWEQRVRICNLRLAERFLNFELDLLLQRCFDSGEEWILGFYEISSVEPVSSEQEMVCQGKKGTVLVDVVELMDSPEIIASTFVWFAPINRLDRLRKHSPHPFRLVCFVFIESFCDRKRNLSHLCVRERKNRGTFHANSNQVICEVIKRSPKIVDDISGHCDDIERQCRNCLNVIGMQEGYGVRRDTRVLIGSENSYVFEGENVGCEISQMLFGPLNLNLNQDKAGGGI